MAAYGELSMATVTGRWLPPISVGQHRTATRESHALRPHPLTERGVALADALVSVEGENMRS